MVVSHFYPRYSFKLKIKGSNKEITFSSFTFSFVVKITVNFHAKCSKDSMNSYIKAQHNNLNYIPLLVYFVVKH